MGAGFEISPYVHWSTDIIAGNSPHETLAGTGKSFLIGYAWDNYNILAFQYNSTRFELEHYNDSLSHQWYTGPVWYHYFGAIGHSYYTVAGVGFYTFSVRGIGGRTGPGIFLGGGYEFSRQVQFGVYISGGKTRATGSPDFKHSQLTLTLTVIAY